MFIDIYFTGQTIQTLRERLVTCPMETVKGGPMKVLRK